MIRIELVPETFPKEEREKRLKENSIFTNRYAEEYFSHSGFSTDKAERCSIVIASLREIGLEDGATLDMIREHISGTDLKVCPANTGLFLRIAWKEQAQSSNSVLSGTHQAPDQAVTVFSELLERRDDFPKGLYLRIVDGKLWLRGYVCDADYSFPSEAMFAFLT